MKIIETRRLMIRPQALSDAEDLFHNVFCDAEVARFMRWTPCANVEEQRAIMQRMMDARGTGASYHWSVVLKEEGRAIGAVGASAQIEADRRADLGYCLGRAYWGRGLMAEALEAAIHCLLFDAGFNRVEAYHAVQNPASGAVMRKAGMFREGRARQKFHCAEGFVDAELYGLVREDLFHPAPFTGFLDAGELRDGELALSCVERQPERPDIGYVPAYLFEMRVDGVRAGEISLRIGMTDSLYYGGQIGYNVEPAFRGRGFAGRGCKLLLPLIRRHGFRSVLITNDPANAASRRVCEKIGARMVRVAELPEGHDLYKQGQRRGCIWVWDVNGAG